MNKFCSLLAKHSLQSCVTRGQPLSSFSRIAFYCTEPKKTVPLSKNPKHKTSPLITLLSGDKLEIITLDNAKKIAERRQMKLVNVVDFDTKTQRAVYRMMTGAEYHEEDIKRREEKKEAKKEQHIKPEKLLTLGTKITEHDLASKMSKCVKWVEKLHEVRVVISGDPSDSQKAEKIANTIEEEVKKVDGRVLQKRLNAGTIKFSIMPTIKKEPKEKPATDKSTKPVKKLLETEVASPDVQQVRAHHTMAF